MSSGRFALVGNKSGEYQTHNMCIIWHDNPYELKFVFEKSIALQTHRIVELPSHPIGRPFIRLRDLPEMADISWPLDPDEWR